MNVLFAAYSRAIEAHFNKYLKPEFIYANGKSERCVGAHFHSLFANHTDTKICDSKNTDVNEFDSSNTDAQAEYDALNLERCRVPEVLIQMYKAQRHVWKLNCPDTIMVEGEQKQHSGQPFTLIFNTATNMSWIGAMYDWDTIIAGGFKGDDSTLHGLGIRNSDKHDVIVDMHNLKIKCEEGLPCEFIGHILSEETFMPDLLKIAAKVSTYVYRSKEHYDDVITSIRNSLLNIPNNEALYKGCCALSIYYKKNKGCAISIDDCLTVASFLNNYVHRPFSSLEENSMICVFH